MKRQGFSLIEVLMVLGIIGVVAAMGFSISQRSIEKAYMQYWYTGYSALQDATFDAIAHQNAETLDNYASHIASLMNATVTDSNNQKIVTAPNGIKYTMDSQLVNGTTIFYIFMQIPVPKQKKQVKDKAPLIFIPSSSSLYPAYVPTNPSPENQMYVESVNLQQRIDLLPYVINDGLPSSAGNHDKSIYNFKDAYCVTHNNVTFNPHTNPSYKYYAIECDVNSGLTPVSGLPVLVNPKKVF